jgi:uncharacterized protein
MNKKEIIQKTADYVKSQLEGESSGHDWWHIYRVWNNAKLIAREEKCDKFIVKLGALLHDIGDPKFHDGDQAVGPKLARKFLKGLGVEEDIIKHVQNIVEKISFTQHVKDAHAETLEAQVVQDADRLDAIGAIGIARAFATGAKFNEIFYDPDVEPGEYISIVKNRTKVHTVINHFYEKLLLLKNLMNTKTGKKIAEARHDYMKKYLDQFFAEWNGKK